MNRSILWLLLCFVVGACSHTATIRSTEPAAHVYVEGAYLGKAPVQFKESTGFGQRYAVEITAPGRHPFSTTIEQTSVEPTLLIGGLILLPFVLATGSVVAVLVAGAHPVIMTLPLLGFIPAFSAFQLQDEYMFPAGTTKDASLDESDAIPLKIVDDFGQKDPGEMTKSELAAEIAKTQASDDKQSRFYRLKQELRTRY